MRYSHSTGVKRPRTFSSLLDTKASVRAAVAVAVELARSETERDSSNNSRQSETISRSFSGVDGVMILQLFCQDQPERFYETAEWDIVATGNNCCRGHKVTVDVMKKGQMPKCN
jgi:hypothetical protein